MELTFNLNGDVHIHTSDEETIKNQLGEILVHLENILAQGGSLMGRAQELTDLVNAVKQNTDDQAAEVTRIRSVVEQVQGQLREGLSKEEADALKESLSTVVAATQTVEDNLKAIGSNPDNPTPEPTPVPEPTPPDTGATTPDTGGVDVGTTPIDTGSTPGENPADSGTAGGGNSMDGSTPGGTL